MILMRYIYFCSLLLRYDSAKKSTPEKSMGIILRKHALCHGMNKMLLSETVNRLWIRPGSAFSGVMQGLTASQNKNSHYLNAALFWPYLIL